MGFRLGIQILIAVLLGVTVGIFFGPYCSALDWIGNAYVMLLQMALVPFIPLALIHGIGSLSPQTAKNLLRKGWYFIPLLWIIVMTVLYLLSLTIPTTQPVIISKDPSSQRDILSDLLSMFTPKTDFYNLSNNILPAVALFGLVTGIAVLLLKKKEPLLPIIEKVLHILERLLHWLALLSPIAIFTHLATATGTIHYADLLRLESYVALVILGTLFLTLWVLPKILEALGPFSYKELLIEAREPCLIALATGVPITAFPFMLRTINRLMHKHHLHHENLHSTSQTVIPLAYSFTQLGNLFLYLFILFMGFFLREALESPEKFLLPIHILFLSLGAPAKSINGVTFLTEHLQWPKEMISYYIDTNAITQNFQVFLSVAGMLCFTLLVLLAYYKSLQVRWKKLFFNLSLGFIVFFGLISIIKLNIHPKDRFQDFYKNLSIFNVIPNPVPFQIDTEETKQPLSQQEQMEPMERILGSKVLRVGFDIRNVPYCFINSFHELAGYDIACGFKLAQDLDCKLEFVPMNRDHLGAELDNGLYDIGMSAILMDENRLLKMDFSKPYAQQSNVLVVARRRLPEFGNYNDIKALPLRLGASGDYKLVASRFFPKASIVENFLISDLLTGKIDAYISSKSPAFVLCLSNPDLVILDFGGMLGQFYFAYAVKEYAVNWASFLDEWLDLREQSGFLQTQHAYWFKGELPTEKTERWSIIRDVFHWVQ